MKLTILQENLARGLSIASRFVAQRAQLPVLSNVLLTTDKGQLKLSATNLETGLNLWLGAKVEQEGSLSVPAKIFTELVASLPVDKVTLTVKENSLNLTCGRTQTDLVGLAASEFPAVPTTKDKAVVSFQSGTLAAAVSQVAFAAAQDEGRPVLTGVLLQTSGPDLVLVATDGYRLSVRKMSQVKGAAAVKEFKKGLIIPSRTLSEVARIIGEGDQEKTVAMSLAPQANQVIFATPDTEVVSRLIEGEFPDFEKIMPTKSDTKVKVETEELTRAVRMAAVFARESANVIKLNFEQKTLQVSANTAQVGSNLSEIEAETTGKKNKIAFNSRYLLDFLATIKSEQLSLEMTSPLNPGVFKPIGETSLLHVIMPVRVQG